MSDVISNFVVKYKKIHTSLSDNIAIRIIFGSVTLTGARHK